MKLRILKIRRGADAMCYASLVVGLALLGWAIVDSIILTFSYPDMTQPRRLLTFPWRIAVQTLGLVLGWSPLAVGAGYWTWRTHEQEAEDLRR